MIFFGNALTVVSFRHRTQKSNPSNNGFSAIKFEVFKDKASEWRWNLKADNNKIIADSGEGYVNKQDCLAGVELVKGGTIAAAIEEHD